jgi:cation transport ATPase
VSKIILASLLVVSSFAFAEEKTCAVKGMHCAACTEMVQGKVCDAAKYSICDVKLVNEKAELGQIHLVTKDKAAKIDEKSVDAAVTDAGYKLNKCSTVKATAKTEKAT